MKKETKYLSLKESTKKKKETTFTHAVDCRLEIFETAATPDKFENALHLGKDRFYGDVFKCWNKGYENDFTIFFGEKGDEFDN